WIHRLDFLCIWPHDDQRWRFRTEIPIRLRPAPHLEYLWKPAAAADCESQRPLYIWQRHAAAWLLSACAGRLRDFREPKQVARSCLSADGRTVEQGLCTPEIHDDIVWRNREFDESHESRL